MDKQKLSVANAEVLKLIEEVVRRQNNAAKLISRIDRSEKTLRHVYNKAKAKTVCLLNKLNKKESKKRERKRKRSKAVSPDPINFSAALGMADGSNEIDWSLFDPSILGF